MLQRIAAVGLCAFALACGNGLDVTGPSAAQTPLESEPAWRQDRTDLLNYFLGHRSTPALYSAQAGHVLSLDWQGNQGAGDSRYAKWATAHEHHRWDAANIYLVEDRNGTVGYAFSSGLWLPRHAQPGTGGRAEANQVTWYDSACSQTKTQPYRYEWLYEGIVRIDFGGVVGTQDAAVLRYIWGPGREERFWYAWEWGWVRWQYIENGKAVHDFTFNQPGQEVSAGVECKG